jgi:cell division protein ZapA
MVADRVTVQIYGEQYTVKAGDDQDYIRRVARIVDEKMREVASSGKVVATSKIAILAALNIADELLQARTELEEESSGDAGRLDAVIARLGKALEESA